LTETRLHQSDHGIDTAATAAHDRGAEADDLQLRAPAAPRRYSTNMPKALRSLVVVIAMAAPAAAPPVSRAAVAPSPHHHAIASVEPSAGQLVGVAMPVTVRFAKPVVDRSAAEQSVQIVSPAKTEGRFTWLNAHAVQWVPSEFWPARSRIHVLGTNFATSFDTAATVVSVADISAHTFTVRIDDQIARQMPASMGKAKYPTPARSGFRSTQRRAT
jgi:lipoprotein-anchoring transpeptidase ErfK/SrfK